MTPFFNQAGANIGHSTSKGACLSPPMLISMGQILQC